MSSVSPMARPLLRLSSRDRQPWPTSGASDKCHLRPQPRPSEPGGDVRKIPLKPGRLRFRRPCSLSVKTVGAWSVFLSASWIEHSKNHHVGHSHGLPQIGLREVASPPRCPSRSHLHTAELTPVLSPVPPDPCLPRATL